MKKIYKQTKIMISIAIIVLLNLDLKSQAFNFSITPSVQCASQYSTFVQANITATQGGATSYSWAITPTNSSLTIGVSSNNYSAFISYVGVGINTIICSAYNGTLLISSVAHTCVVYPSPIPFAISSLTPNICSGTPITLSTSPQAINNCTWFPTNSIGSAITLTPSTSTCYSAVVTNSYNCSYTTNPYCVNVGNSAPTLSLNVPSTFSLCTGFTWITVTGAANYSWSTSGGGIIQMSPPFTGNLCVAHGIGCYTVVGVNGCGTSTAQACAIANSPAPTFGVNGPASICAGATTTLSVNLNTTVPSYYQFNDFYWYAPPAWTNQIANNSSVAITVTANTCYTLLAQNQVCNGNPAVHCVSVIPSPTLNVSGTNTVCLGSSTNFTASGGNTYTWSTNANTSTINVLPLTSTTYSIAGSWTANSCVSNATIGVTVFTTCADVWPGDANRDGLVSTADVLELGLAASSTGAARSSTSNAWASQYASAWSGTVSTGWNMAHADCNGDGVVNSNDNTAITTNFALTHSFKSNNTSANPDISIVPQQNLAYEGIWNKADIILGDATNTISQLYGVAFDINYDQSKIQTDSVKIIYAASFLNANNQNIDFSKAIFANGKLYCASVRVDHSNINGTGKIAEFWYKVKTGLPANSSIVISAGNAQKVNANGAFNGLSNDAGTTVNISSNLTGLNESLFTPSSINMYPNPSNKMVQLSSESLNIVAYSIFDLVGKEIMKGEFKAITNIDVSRLAAGNYFVKFSSNNIQVTKKLVVTN